MLNLIDIWMLKNNTEMALDQERKFIKILYSRMERAAKINEFWLHTDEYQGIMKYDMPKWYTKELSLAYDVHDMEVTPVEELLKLIKDKAGEVTQNVMAKAQNEVEKRMANNLAEMIVPNKKPQIKVQKK